jgi:ABC-type multidrug transport system permease subunit
MSVLWTLVKKELRLLVRDRIAGALLLVMPLVFILLLGMLLGEGFGEKPDARLRVSLVRLDHGTGLEPGEPWSKVVQDDLAETAGIKVEVIDSLETAQQLVENHKRAAVLIFKPTFTDRVNECSFLSSGINPFFRDGVYLDRVDAKILKDPKQPGTAAIIEQVAQVSLLRVLMPWMIGRAFDKLSDPSFLGVLAREAKIPLPESILNSPLFKAQMGSGIKKALQDLFSKYNLTGKTWADLTRAKGQREGEGTKVSQYHDRDVKFQLLVPSYTVMFAFALVCIVGYVFVAERRQGTLRRLRAAPVARWQVLLGKLIPSYAVSLGQTLFLLLAGRVLFGMRWGPEQWPWWEQLAWLLPVVFCTSLAAMGMALLVAALAKTEIQVALYAIVPVLVLSFVGGCVLPREMMPEQTRWLTLATPQGWALEAYRELLVPPDESGSKYDPNPAIVFRACGVLAVFGLGCLGLAWATLRLD